MWGHVPTGSPLVGGFIDALRLSAMGAQHLAWWVDWNAHRSADASRPLPEDLGEDRPAAQLTYHRAA
jgi:hypothetical protein